MLVITFELGYSAYHLKYLSICISKNYKYLSFTVIAVLICAYRDGLKYKIELL